MDARSILAAAVLAGGLGGFAWSVLSAPAAPPPQLIKAETIALPASPEELPAAPDREWSVRADDSLASAGAAAPADSEPTVAAVSYSGCRDVRAAGKAPLLLGQPGYREEMDGDGDGIACEHRPGAG